MSIPRWALGDQNDALFESLSFRDSHVLKGFGDSKTRVLRKREQECFLQQLLDVEWDSTQIRLDLLRNGLILRTGRVRLTR